MLRYGANEWRRLPWWEQRIYRSGMAWELERGGLNPHPDVIRAREEGGGGGGATQSTYIPFDSMEARAAEGITVIGP